MMKNNAGYVTRCGFFLVMFAVLSMGGFVVPVSAQSSSTQIQKLAAQVQSNIIRLTPNESKILHLNKNATSVVVANPVHASVFLDTPRILVIVPGTPGATSFTILDKDGNQIMKSDVIVSDRRHKYVRIQRVCTAALQGCVPTSVYYCPDGCHQVVTADPNVTGGSSASISTASSTVASSLTAAPTTASGQTGGGQ